MNLKNLNPWFTESFLEDTNFKVYIIKYHNILKNLFSIQSIKYSSKVDRGSSQL